MINSRKDEVVKKRMEGYNCAQAVACTYCDMVDVDEQTMFKLTEGLGTGMGNMKGTCGAIAGACVIAGLANSNGDMEKKDSKMSTGKLSKAIMQSFEERNKAVTCMELKGVGTGKVLRACPDCVGDAAEFLEKIVLDNK